MMRRGISSIAVPRLALAAAAGAACVAHRCYSSNWFPASAAALPQQRSLLHTGPLILSPATSSGHRCADQLFMSPLLVPKFSWSQHRRFSSASSSTSNDDGKATRSKAGIFISAKFLLSTCFLAATVFASYQGLCLYQQHQAIEEKKKQELAYLTDLCEAIEESNINEVHKLAHADPAAFKLNERKALCSAVRCAEYEVLKLLLKLGANPRTTAEEVKAGAQSHLLLAARNATSLEILLHHDPSLYSQGEKEKCLFESLKNSESATCLRLLVQHGLDIKNALDSKTGCSPVVHFLKHSCTSASRTCEWYEALKTLIDAGADVNTPDPKTGCSPIVYFLKHSYTSANRTCEWYEAFLKTLIDAGSDVNMPDPKTGKTPLMLLLEMPCEYDQYGGLMVASSAQKDFPEKGISVLIKAGADVNAKNPHTGDTALMVLSPRFQYGESLPWVKGLIAAGADVNATNNHGFTALQVHRAKAYNGPEAELLIKAGAH